MIDRKGRWVSGSAAEASIRERRILVVDDNKDSAASLATLLQVESHYVKAVYTAEAALEQHQCISRCILVAKLCHAAVWLTITAVSSMHTTQVLPKAVAR